MVNWKTSVLLSTAIVFGVLACSAGQGEDAEAERGERGSAAVTDVGRLPLEAYRLDHEEEAAYHRARDLLLHACMKRAGFEWRVSSKAPSQPDPRRRRYGINDAGTAQAYGYHPPTDDPRAALEADRALFRQPGAEEAYAGPEGTEGLGCAAQAEKRLAQGAGPVRRELFGVLDEESLNRSRRHPAVVTALQAWADCMRERGHPYETPYKAAADGWGSPDTEPSHRERAVATADVACKQRTGLVTTWLRVETDIQRGLITEHTEELARLRQADDVYRSNTAEVLSASDW